MYVCGPVTKWRHWSMFITLGKQSFVFPERCTSQNDASTDFLEVQIPLRVLMYDWGP